jgi:hypothetical protein
MTRVVRAILVHFCSFLLAVPVGWCCWLPTLRSSEKEPECCCCAKPETPAPTKKQPETPEAPSCCCDPQPAAILSKFNDRSHVLVDALPAVFAGASAELHTTCIGLTSPIAFLNAPTPPLRVLHCVWLC